MATLLTHLPNIKHSHDTPTAEGGINPVLQRKNTQTTRWRDPSQTVPTRRRAPIPPCSPAPGPQTPGPALTPAAQSQEGFCSAGRERIQKASVFPFPRGTALGVSVRGGSQRLLCPHRNGRSPPRGGSAPGRLSPGPTAGETKPGAAGPPRPHPGPVSRRAPTLSPPRAEPPPDRGERQGLCPSADPAPDAPACGRRRRRRRRGPAPGRARSPFPDRRSTTGAKWPPPPPPTPQLGSGRRRAGPGRLPAGWGGWAPPSSSRDSGSGRGGGKGGASGGGGRPPGRAWHRGAPLGLASAGGRAGGGPGPCWAAVKLWGDAFDPGNKATGLYLCPAGRSRARWAGPAVPPLVPAVSLLPGRALLLQRSWRWPT